MSKLYIVPTPIGNLGDMTYRAVEVLRQANLILAEDTRTSIKLLRHFEISTHMESYHMHNEHQLLEQYTKRIAHGTHTALITDAGTPAISDPGFLLVRACIQQGIAVETLPGATAFVPALVNSGLPNDRFAFEGFLPQKKGRHKKLNALRDEARTMVFYESPHRLVKALQQMAEVFGQDRQAAVSREISKLHEENQRGTLAQLIEYFGQKNVKGEIVIVVDGQNEK